jgi:hypothetical protein
MRKFAARIPILLLFLSLSVSAFAQCSVQTDKADYYPGEVAYITGSGWQPGEIVDLLLQRSCGCPPTAWSINADAKGNIATQYQVVDADLGVTFVLTATGESSGCVATTTFTDAQPNHVLFATAGLPAGVAITISTTHTNSGCSNIVTESRSFNSPGPSAPTVDACPATAFIYSGYPSTVTVSGVTYNLISTVPASGFITGVANTTTTVTGTYQLACTTPTITCPSSSSAPADSNCQAAIPDLRSSAIVTGNCSPAVTQSPAPGTLVGLGPHTITLTATNTALQSASCTTTFTVNDTTPPVITTCPQGSNLGCNPVNLPTCASVSAQVSATDNCGTPTLSCMQSDSDNGCMHTRTFTVTASDGVNSSSPCVVTYTWKVDMTPPVLSGLPTGGDLGCNPTAPSCSNAVTAMDDCDGSVPVHCSAGSITSTGCMRSQTFTYSAVDSCNNMSSQDVIYTWKVDTTPPVLSGLPTGGDLG